jgi:hypothetical protein
MAYILIILLSFSLIATPAILEDECLKITHKRVATAPENTFFDEFRRSGIVDPFQTKKTVYKSLLKHLNQDDAMVISCSVIDNSIKYNVGYKLILSMINIESNFIPTVVNERNCYGLMQIRPSFEGRDVWEKELKLKGIIRTKNDLLEPHINIMAGTYILKKYCLTYKYPSVILSRYSGDDDNVEYVKRVLNRYKQYQGVL